MYLVEILLPLRDDEGHPFAARTYDALRDELSERYGGVTAFTRAPAEGETKIAGRKVCDDFRMRSWCALSRSTDCSDVIGAR